MPPEVFDPSPTQGILPRLRVHAGERPARALGERGGIIKAMHRALRGQQREMVLFDANTRVAPIVGRVLATGYLDELDERAYVIVDGMDRRAHHVPIGQKDPAELPVGGIVEIRPIPQRTVDRNIAALSRDGIYRTAEHRAQLALRDDLRHHPDEIIDGHVRRLESLRGAGIVERRADGIWRIPADLAARGHAYDRQRTGGLEVQVHSHQPVDKQITTLGATWLDRTLVGTDTPGPCRLRCKGKGGFA